jgi:hypothetical protein
MKVTISIQGAGTVKGAGEYSSGSKISLEAIPASSFSFMYWKKGEEILSTEVEFDFDAANSDEHLTAYFFMPIEAYLKGRVGYPVPEDAILAAELNWDISYNSDALSLTKRQKDLAFADLLMYVASTPSMSGEKDQMGNWMHQGKSFNVENAGQLVEQAQSIYDLYGEKKRKGKIYDATSRW